MTDAGRLPLYLMIGCLSCSMACCLPGCRISTGFKGPPDVFRLTRYVVRFPKPEPTQVATLTQVAVVQPVAVEPAPIEPVVDRQIPKPIERVETRPSKS